MGVQAASAAVTVTKTSFGLVMPGKAADIYTLKNGELIVDLTNYGARIVSLKTKDRNGRFGDVALGYESASGYAEPKGKTYFGAIVGRYGNRIAGGKFTLDGKTYQIPLNNGPNALHGGPVGFGDQMWTGKIIPDGVEMTLVSPDGDMGFPGTMTVHVRYTLVGSAVHINYEATSDKDTVVNVTNHTYFNLSGEGSGTILDEVLQINADEYTPVDAGLIPVGGPKPVAGTPFDFRKPTAIGARIHQDDAQLKIGGGYDHNWILRGKNGEMKEAARLYDPEVGAGADGIDDRAGGAVLFRQQPDGGLQGKVRRDLQQEHGAVPGDAALSGFAEPAGVSKHGTEGGSDDAVGDGICVFDAGGEVAAKHGCGDERVQR
jgi:aldose 1-epimerase